MESESNEAAQEMGRINCAHVEWPGCARRGVVIDQLKGFGELEAQGVLTDEDLAALKAELIG